MKCVDCGKKLDVSQEVLWKGNVLGLCKQDEKKFWDEIERFK